MNYRRLISIMFLFAALSFLSCRSKPDLIPVDKPERVNPGDYFEVKLKSSLVQSRYDYLIDYMEDQYPELLPVELVRAYGQAVDGKNVILECRYEEDNGSAVLKAEIRGNRDGEITGRTIKFLGVKEESSL